MAIANILTIAIGKLTPQVDFHTNIPDLTPEEKTPSQIAQQVRFAWKAQGPIKNLPALLEKNGIIIVEFDFKNSKMDGFTINSGSNPVIFLNESFPTDRKRRTLAHELGHIVMHDTPTDNCEIEADEFASEFLLPEREVSYSLKYLTLSKLSDLKRVHRVSMQALIMRACQLGAITERQKTNLFINLSKKGLRKDEKIPLPEEKPTLLRKIVRAHYDQLGYSREDLARVLNLRPTIIDKYFVKEVSKVIRLV